MAITLPREAVNRLTPSMKRFFDEQLDIEISDMKAAAVLDYVLKEIGPLVYNHAISDARDYFADRLGDLDASCYEKEFTYWPEKSNRSRPQSGQS
jgi:uncharacterized protein (DUF2164 family)